MKNTWNEGGAQAGGVASAFCVTSHWLCSLTWLFHTQCSNCSSYVLPPVPSSRPHGQTMPSSPILVTCDIFISIPKLIDIPKCDWDVCTYTQCKNKSLTQSFLMLMCLAFSAESARWVYNPRYSATKQRPNSGWASPWISIATSIVDT